MLSELRLAETSIRTAPTFQNYLEKRLSNFLCNVISVWVVQKFSLREYERKSVGTESTFRELSGKTELREKLRHIAEELEKDLERTHIKDALWS